MSPSTVLLALVGSGFSSSAMAADRTSAASALKKLFEDAWEYDLREDPVRASLLGDRRWNDHWPDMSLAAIERRHAHDREVLSSLGAIDAALEPGDRVSY